MVLTLGITCATASAQDVGKATGNVTNKVVGKVVGKVEGGGAAAPAVDELFATDHLFVRVRPGCTMATTSLGDLTFRTATGMGDVALSRIMKSVGVDSIRLALADPPKRADIATQVGLDRWYRVSIAPGSNALAVADMLRASWVGFEVCEVDGIGGLADIPNDTSFATQYSLLNTGQSGGTIGADIRATQAWSVTSSNPTIIIALLDSGVFPHTELAGRILPGRNIPLGTTDTSDVCGGHGTHVSGIMTAKGANAAGIAGMCWDAKILPVVIVNPCSGLESYVADGLVWAVDQGADVVNMSLQYNLGSEYLHAAVQYAAAHGVPMVAATGNSNGPVAWPAKWDETIAVAGSNRFDMRYSVSNFGPEVDVTAPGDTIYSLALANGYVNRSGTSMATPHVTGTIALMRSVYPTMSAATIRSVLMQTARDLAPVGFDDYTGAGVINAGAAVILAQSMNPGPADMNGDGHVDGADLTTFFSQWGICVGCNCAGDFNHDCAVDASDLSALLSSWSPQ